MQHPSASGATRRRRTRPATKTPREQLARFDIETELCPQVLLRILGLMSRDGSIPVTVSVTRLPDTISIAIELECTPWTRCEQLVTRLEELPMVRKAEVSRHDTLIRGSRKGHSGLA